MPNNNSVLIDKDILAALGPASAGDSEVVKLRIGSSKRSCQAVYDVLSFSAAVEDSASDIFDEEDAEHPSQFFKEDHGFVTGLKVQIATDDTLPDPLQATTDYFVIKIDDDYYQLASSLANALAGIEIPLADVGVEVQTMTAVALAGASVTFRKSNNGGVYQFQPNYSSGHTDYFPITRRRLSLSATTTVYLVGQITASSVGTQWTSDSILSARRVR